MERLQQLPVGTTVSDAYRLVRRIGEGALGTVYEATPLGRGKRCAVKVLHGAIAESVGDLARFHSQAEMASRLQDPNLVRVLDFGTVDTGQPYLAMEYLDGEDLASRLARVGRIKPPSVTYILKQVALALAPLHKQGLAHLGIKPSNIFLITDDDGRDLVKVLDFGTAQVEHARSLTHPTKLTDALPYVSPAQVNDEPLDDRCDQWALACIAWQMLSGRAPFAGEDATALLYQIAYEDPVLADDVQVPPGVMEVLRQALEKRPEQRFPDIAEFVRAFEEVAGTLPPPKRQRAPAPARAVASERGTQPVGQGEPALPGLSPRQADPPRRGWLARQTRVQGLRVRSAGAGAPGDPVAVVPAPGGSSSSRQTSCISEPGGTGRARGAAGRATTGARTGRCPLPGLVGGSGAATDGHPVATLGAGRVGAGLAGGRLAQPVGQLRAERAGERGAGLGGGHLVAPGHPRRTAGDRTAGRQSAGAPGAEGTPPLAPGSPDQASGQGPPSRASGALNPVSLPGWRRIRQFSGEPRALEARGGCRALAIV